VPPTRRQLLLAVLSTATSVPARADSPLLITTGEKWGGGWVAAQLLTEVYRQAGLQLRIMPLPPSRANMMTFDGQSDGELIRLPSYGDDHPQLIRVDPAYYSVSVAAYSMPQRRVQVQTPGDLQAYSVGGIRGFMYVQRLLGEHRAATLVPNSEQMFRMLRPSHLGAQRQRQVQSCGVARTVWLERALGHPSCRQSASHAIRL